ncbi:MAG: DoxX family membrane protein [Pseudomonadota bacterium]
MKKFLPLLLVIVPVFVFLQSLPFKFSGAAETVYIFDTIGAWFADIGLDAIAQPFADFGAYGVGIAELIASILLIIPATRHWGALFGLGILSGAIFFHLFTPLGVAVEFPGAAEGGDPLLFIMAVIAWSCLLALVIRHRDRLPLIGNRAAPAPVPAPDA